MLDWLKEILGEGYTDDADKKISGEIGKRFVSKADFNSVNEAKKQLEATVSERDAQLEELKKSTGMNDDLKSQIETLQQQNKDQRTQYEKEIEEIKLGAAIDAALSAAGAKNLTATKALIETEGLKLGSDGKIEGLDDKIKALIDGEETSFLFAKDKPGFKGLKPFDGKPGGGGGGDDVKNMSYSELCAYLEQNPNAKLD